MTFKLGAVVYFCIIAISIASIAIDLFGVPEWYTISQGTELLPVGAAFEAIPFVLLLLGILLIFYTLKNYPSKNSDSSKIPEHSEAVSLKNVIRFPTRRSGIDLPSTNLDSETTLQIDEIDFDHAEREELLSEDSITSYTNPPDIDPITKARVYVSCGRNFQAIDLLMESLDEKDCDYDELVIELIETMEKEIRHHRTSKERKDFLYSQRDDFLQRVSKERMRLSTDVWRQIHMKYPVQTDASLYKIGTIVTQPKHAVAKA